VVQDLEGFVRQHQIDIANMRRILLSLVILLFLMMSACCKSFDSSTKRENEAARPWVTESWRGQYDWKPVERHKSVTTSKSSGAETLLQAKAVLQITASEAQELVGESIPDGKQTPYLLRGVGDANETFPLELAVRPDGTVWIGGGANSKCSVPMKRRPVVAWLDRMPEKAYVTFYVNRD
jgi:hypothetical protein